MKEISLEIILNKMFEFAESNLTYSDVIDQENWYNENTMTEEQNKKWIEWLTNYINQNTHLSLHRSKKEALQINLIWGLKIN